jgi:ribosomal protein S12 methylthiotransferase
MNILLISLGCAKNQVDSEILAGILDSGGHTLVTDSSEADAAIVNTCGFIAPAVEESIDTILELELLKKSGEIRFLAVVGCLVNRYEKELRAELESVDLWARAGEWKTLAKALGGQLSTENQLALPGYTRFSRYLKISEGCNNRCSYCTIPMIRGPLASQPLPGIIENAERLVLSGAKEICLVGQDLTTYGKDISPSLSLCGLMESLEERFRGEDLWFRLLYLHPARVDEKLVEKVASSDLFLNYLDVPVQHVEERILASMNRGGLDRKRISRIFNWARTADPDFALRTTLMVGYPGETEEEFNSLLDFISESRIDRLGVFPYYPEEGTPAALMEGQIPGEIKQERVDRVTVLQEEVSLERQRRLEGRIIKVLVEISDPAEDFAEGRSFREAPEVDGVVEIRSGPLPEPGDFVPVLITEAMEHDLVGEVAR